MSRVLLVIVFLSVAVSGNSQVSDAAQPNHFALYAPRPEYPLAAQIRQWRFEPGNKLKLVNIPMTFWMDGSAARRRMSGAVISY